MSVFRRVGDANRTRRGAIAIVAVLALIAAGCGNDWGKSIKVGSSTDTHLKVTAPGVTDTEIRVGGVVSVTNPLGGPFGDSFAGVQAYFDMVNAKGGIYGRKLVLAAQRDDKLANNKSEIQGLLTQDHVFAVLPVASLLFTGSDLLVQQRIPTFGWTINPEWQGSPQDPRDNLFGEDGSFLCFNCSSPTLPWLAGQAHAHKIGLLAYSVAQSSDCADGVKASFNQYGHFTDSHVAFVDQSLSYGASDLSVQVSKMKDAGVDMVTTCMDTNGVVTLAKEMKKQHLKAIQYLPDAYDHSFLDEFGDLFEGSYVRTDFVQWEVADKPPGLAEFLKGIADKGLPPTENSMNGWLNAALFVAGLKAAGPTFDREKLIAAINKMTHFTAEGLLNGTNWTKEHTQLATPGTACQFISLVHNSKFEPVFTKPGKPFVCAVATPNGLETRYQ